MKTYKIKGLMLFCYNKENGIMYATEDYTEEYLQPITEKTVYDLIPGKEFIKHVDSGCIIDEDGSIANIFVDSYESNLGLTHKGFTGGHFLVDKEAFLDICKNHKVIVNWANK